MTFELYRLRFQFRAGATLYFPPYKSSNIVRGGFGSILKRLVCVPGCRDAKVCESRVSCPYAKIFEPRAAKGEGPSGLADWPRPFVFRAAHLDGSTVENREPFHFDVHLFDVHDPALAYFVATFVQLAREGLGPGRGRAELIAVYQLDLSGTTVQQVFNGERFNTGHLAAPISIELGSKPQTVEHVRVRFVTPTELKSEQQVANAPEFGILFGRLRDRISTLRALYNAGPLEIDFHGMGQRAKAVSMTRCDVRQIDVSRTSSRSGQRHSLGGFVGEAEYSGELGEFVSYLQLGKWVGVGRHAVWGNGELVLLS